VLKIYNTLTRRLEEFKPIDKNLVKMYVCGPTVYNHIHIGNARPIVVFDMVHRYLRYLGYDVKFVQNFTDIDDKIINRANEEGMSFKALAEKYIVKYFEDTKDLNLLEEKILHPKATEYIAEMESFVQELIAKKHAYETQGDVYFDVESFKEYGKLSDQKMDELQTGVRKELMDGKRSPTDFALWKSAKDGEPFWETQFGKGRPGWHLECSVMGREILGEVFDIHGGGIDLVFPHHENEIAQSHCFSGQPPVNYWMHNGFLKIEGEKMSKSLNNFMLLKDVNQEFEGSVIRLFFLQSHYRKPIDFSRAELEMTKASLERLRNSYARIKSVAEKSSDSESEYDAQIVLSLESAKVEFEEGMNSDFNTAIANGALFQLIKSINQILDLSQERVSKKVILNVKAFLSETLEGIFALKLENCDIIEGDSSVYVDYLVNLRYSAKLDKNFALADSIRNFLLEQDIEIRDSKEGSSWKKISK